MGWGFWVTCLEEEEPTDKGRRKKVNFEPPGERGMYDGDSGI